MQNALVENLKKELEDGISDDVEDKFSVVVENYLKLKDGILLLQIEQQQANGLLPPRDREGAEATNISMTGVLLQSLDAAYYKIALGATVTPTLPPPPERPQPKGWHKAVVEGLYKGTARNVGLSLTFMTCCLALFALTYFSDWFNAEKRPKKILPLHLTAWDTLVFIVISVFIFALIDVVFSVVNNAAENSRRHQEWRVNYADWNNRYEEVELRKRAGEISQKIRDMLSV